MSNSTRFYMVRHGETDWNVKGIIQGHTDTKLTEKGREQARTLAGELEGIPFDYAYSSDLSRAKDTADIVLEGRPISLVTDVRLRERDYGSMVGKSRDEYRAFFDQNPSEGGKSELEPDAETEQEAYVRFRGFLDSVSSEHEGQTVLIVTHKGLIHAFLRKGFGDTYAHLKLGDIQNTGYILVEGTEDVMRVLETKGVRL